jgi:hypothetical protein
VDADIKGCFDNINHQVILDRVPDVSGLRHSETGAILGMFGLHRRVGPTAIEVGYWLHPGYLGRGYATRSVGVLTEVALGCGMLTASKSIPTRPIRRALRFPGGSVIGSIGSNRRWTCRKRAPTERVSPGTRVNAEELLLKD